MLQKHTTKHNVRLLSKIWRTTNADFLSKRQAYLLHAIYTLIYASRWMLHNVIYSAWCVPSENMRAKYDQDTAETFCYLQ